MGKRAIITCLEFPIDEETRFNVYKKQVELGCTHVAQVGVLLVAGGSEDVDSVAKKDSDRLS